MPNLRTFTFHHGTASQPLAVTAAHVAALVAVAQDPAVACDVSGFIRPQNGTINAGDKYLLHQAFPDLTVVATESQDAFSLYRLGDGPVDEGSSLEILSTGIAVSALTVEVESHNITGRSAEITDDALRSRITLRRDGTRLWLDVAPPQENASWTDEVTLAAWPTYAPDNRQTLTLVARATRIDAIDIDAADTVQLGDTLECRLAITPAANTKAPYARTEWSASAGRMVGATFFPPEGEVTTVTLSARLYLFAASAPAFVAQKSVRVDEPYILAHIQGLEPADADKGRIRIADTTDAASAPQTLAHGDRIRAIPDHEYTATAQDVDGYTVSTTPAAFRATRGENRVTATYKAPPYGVFAVFADGDTEPIDTWDRQTTNAAGSPLVAAGLRTSQCAFMIAASTSLEGTITADEPPAYHTAAQAMADYAGFANTTAMAGRSGSVFTLARARRLTVGSEERQGYVGAVGELMAVASAKDQLNPILAALGLDTIPWPDRGSRVCVSSNKADRNNFYVFSNFSETTPGQANSSRSFYTIVLFPLGRL